MSLTPRKRGFTSLFPPGPIRIPSRYGALRWNHNSLTSASTSYNIRKFPSHTNNNNNSDTENETTRQGSIHARFSNNKSLTTVTPISKNLGLRSVPNMNSSKWRGSLFKNTVQSLQKIPDSESAGGGGGGVVVGVKNPPTTSHTNSTPSPSSRHKGTPIFSKPHHNDKIMEHMRIKTQLITSQANNNSWDAPRILPISSPAQFGGTGGRIKMEEEVTPRESSSSKKQATAAGKKSSRFKKHYRWAFMATTQNREQELRSIQERIKVHYMLQEETLKHLPVPEKLPRIIHNLVKFEKEILDYMAAPNPHSEAKIILKDLRTRRAEMMNRLSTFTESKVKFFGDIGAIANPENLHHTFPTPKGSRRSLRNEKVNVVSAKLEEEPESTKNEPGITARQVSSVKESKTEAVDGDEGQDASPDQQQAPSRKARSKKPVKKLSNKLGPKLGGKESSRSRSKPIPRRPNDKILAALEAHQRFKKLIETADKSLIRTTQTKVPAQVQTSPKPSGAELGKTQTMSKTSVLTFNRAERTTAPTNYNSSSSPAVKWNKSDFIRLLPHPGEIPKNVSKISTNLIQQQSLQSTPKTDNNNSNSNPGNIGNVGKVPPDTNTYMNWLHELLSQKLDQNENLASTTPATTAGMVKEQEKRAKNQAPNWTKIANKKEEKPIEKFKRTYEGFIKGASLFETASRNRKAFLNNLETDTRSFTPPDPLLNKHAAFLPQYSMNRDLESVSNTIRAVLANPLRHSQQQQNKQLLISTISTPNQQTNINSFKRETSAFPAAPFPASMDNNDGSNSSSVPRKIPKMLFSGNTNSMNVNTLMKPKILDRKEASEDSKLTLFYGSSLNTTFPTEFLESTSKSQALFAAAIEASSNNNRSHHGGTVANNSVSFHPTVKDLGDTNGKVSKVETPKFSQAKQQQQHSQAKLPGAQEPPGPRVQFTKDLISVPRMSLPIPNYAHPTFGNPMTPDFQFSDYVPFK